MLTMDIAEEGKCSMMLTDVKISACLCVCVTPLFSSAGLFVAISVGVVVVAAGTDGVGAVAGVCETPPLPQTA